MSNVSGSMASNKRNQQQQPAGKKSMFRSGEGADGAPRADKGKNFGQMKNKQAKYGKKPDKDGVGSSSTEGVRFDAAIHRSGGQQN